MKLPEKMIRSGILPAVKNLLLVGAALIFSAMITPAMAAKPDCDENPSHPSCKSDGGGGDDLSKLVRVQMADWGGAGISRDNVEMCIPTLGPTYDYWAGTDSGLIGGAGCAFHDIRSDASGGGRWFLKLPTNEPPFSHTTRWLSVDFSSSPFGDVCPDFEDDANGNTDPIYPSHEVPATAPLVCVDNLAVWIQAQRALHKSASRTPLKIRLLKRGEGDVSEYWTEFAFIEYIDPLYLRIPESGDVGFETGCQRLISTEPGSTGGTVHVREAELREWVSVFSGPLIGTYDLRFEACLTRAE